MNNKVRGTLLGSILIITIVFTSISGNIEASNLKNNVNKLKYINSKPIIYPEKNEKTQLSFAAFADTHIGARYQYPYLFSGFKTADYLDKIGNNLVDTTNLLDFAIHLGDIVNHNTAHVNGIGLPWYVNKYKNNLKEFLISNVNIPFHLVLGNHDLDDYELNPDNPHKLVESLIDESSMNCPVYAMMRDGILFLIVPELGYVQWTHPVLYEWVEYMTQQYPNTTTIILCHQAIEDTTKTNLNYSYRGKQDTEWWANLFQKNPQIKIWIHGHNHYLDWYVNNQSTGSEDYPIYYFGHDMAFSAPYPQIDFYKLHETDRIVIYNITSTGISTVTWENNGFRGYWVSDYMHSFDIPTTFDPEAEDWYAYSMFLQDNETQYTDMKILSPNIKLQLIGTIPMEQFYDSKMESPAGYRYGLNETILGFGNDREGNVIWTNPGMKVHGPTIITFPEKYPFPDEKLLHEDGRSGPSYRSFPMGTICSAVPGQTYNFTITARCNSGSGRIKLYVSCCDWSMKSQYSVLPNSEKQIFSHIFGTNYETITARYTVPNDEKAWFLQGSLEFTGYTDYDVSLFSVHREQNSNKTENFHLCLSDNWYNVSGPLDEDEIKDFSINPTELCDNEGVINFTAFIDGNKFGMVNLVFKEPVLLCRNARFYVNSFNNDVFNLSVTKTISKSSKIFKIYPFSTDSIYDYLNIKSEDNSGVRHFSKNGNIWLSCNCPDYENHYIEVSLKGGIINKPKQKHLYLFDNDIGSTLLGNTIVIGKIKVQVCPNYEENVSKVEFYIDDNKQFFDDTSPYEWFWDKISFSRHNLMVKTYYNNGFISEDKIYLLKFF